LGPARQARCSTPSALVRVRAPLFKEPSLWLGFCFSATGLSIELRSIIHRKRLTPSGPARQARCSTPAALVRVRAPLFKEPSLWLGFCFPATGLSIELRSIIRHKRLTPSGPARQARCSTPAALVRVRAPLYAVLFIN
jgi:hypothetical protein